MSCCKNRWEIKRPSTLPPSCYHCRPPPFCCPKDGCPPPEPRVRKPCCCPPSCPPFISEPEPKASEPFPTICVAGPCPQPPGPKPYSPPSPPRIKPPLSYVRFCIRNTCQGSTYYPCYTCEAPRCELLDTNNCP